MEIERERGITIKAQTVRLDYRAADGEDYVLNLMDTPGHVDFAYEVSRSLRACEGSLLVVDASQGVEAQTLANVYQAIEAGHEIVPVLNKIDLPAAEPDRVKAADRGRDRPRRLRRAADLGQDRAQHRRRAGGHGHPAAAAEGRRRGAAEGALVVDSWYDPYLGVVILVRVKDGTLAQGPEDPPDGDRRRARDRAGRRLHPEGVAVDSAGAGRDRLHHRRHQDRRRLPGRRHDHRGPPPAPRRRCPASSRCSRSCSAACSRPTPPITSGCATASPSCASTTPASNTSPRPRWRSASASAAAFSASCISKSSRSGWSASSTST